MGGGADGLRRDAVAGWNGHRDRSQTSTYAARSRAWARISPRTVAAWKLQGEDGDAGKEGPRAGTAVPPALQVYRPIRVQALAVSFLKRALPSGSQSRSCHAAAASGSD